MFQIILLFLSMWTSQISISVNRETHFAFILPEFYPDHHIISHIQSWVTLGTSLWTLPGMSPHKKNWKNTTTIVSMASNSVLVSIYLNLAIVSFIHQDKDELCSILPLLFRLILKENLFFFFHLIYGPQWSKITPVSAQK